MKKIAMASALKVVTQPLTNTPVDLLRLQSDQVRRGEYLVLGRVNKIFIGPASDYQPPLSDPLIQKYGRMVDFNSHFLPIGVPTQQGQELGPLTRPVGLINSLLIIKAWWHREWGVAGCPDLPHPDWKPRAYTRKEVTLEGMKYNPVTHQYEDRHGNPASYKGRTAPLVPQRLIDRANQEDGRPAKLEGTNFLIFQPVLSFTYQPEFLGRTVSAIWTVGCAPDSTGIFPVLLVDPDTGEAHFYGGCYDVGIKARGEA